MRISHPGLWLFLAMAPALAAQQVFAELSKRHLPESLSDVWAVAVIDFENDGDLDLLIGRNLQPSTIWRNDGFGTFSDAGPNGALAASEPTWAFAVGDVNGDGVEDIVWATAGGGMRLLFGGNTNNTYWDAPSSFLPAHGAFIQAVCLFDVDGDGDLDLVFAESGGATGTDRLFVNNGTGAFTDATGPWLVGGGSYGSNSFEPFDADGDGDLDLLGVSWNAVPILRINQGTTFSAVSLPATVGKAFAADSGDVDGDGDLDLIIGTSSSNPQLRQDRLLRNNGSGTFTDDTATSMPVLANFTTQVHMTDIDGDGDLDALISHQQTTFLGSRIGHALFENDGTGNFSDASAELPQNDLTGAQSVAFDADGDGDDDYMMSGFSQGQDLYWNDQGRMVHASGSQLPERKGAIEGVASGDLDGDGLPELIAAGWNFSILGGRNSLFWNDGTGRMAEAASNPTWPIGFYACADLGDIDGDGDLDVVFGLDQPGQNRLYRNDGNRVLIDVTATAMPALSDFTNAIRFFDADGDGDLDLIVGNGSQCRLHANDGLGNFTEVPNAVPQGSSTEGLAIGDVDLDGDLDIVRANYSGANELWLNSGGTFSVAPSNMPSLVQATSEVALVDLDADGDLDLLVGNTNTGPDPRSWIRYNDGSGNFTAAPVSLGSLDVRAIATADIEGDGDVDIVLGGLNVPTRLYENVGAGSFVSQPGAMPSDARSTEDLVLTDIDGDGDLDLFEGGLGSDRVLTNMHRQLHADHLLVLGGSTTYALHAIGGAPGAIPFAALSLGYPAAPVATPFGPARLDLATFVPIAVLSLPPSQPHAEWVLTVPANPTLLGLDIGAQALIAHGLQSTWRLSGLVADPVR